MTSNRSAFLGIAAAVSILSLAGCYTQFGSSRHERDADETYGEEVSDDSAEMDDYAIAREKFYDDSYYPGFNVGVRFGWGYPWYGYGSGFGYLGYYDSYFLYGGAIPWHRWGDPLLYYGDGGYSHRRPNTTRVFGSTRTLGGSRSSTDAGRSSAGYQPLPVGSRGVSIPGSGPGKGGSVNRPTQGVSTGRRGVEGERRGQGVSPPRYVPPPPAPSHDSGRTNTGSGRSSERPTYNPPPPPPSHQAPSGGSRGSDTRGGGSGGGTREGNRR